MIDDHVSQSQKLMVFTVRGARRFGKQEEGCNDPDEYEVVYPISIVMFY